ANIGVIDTSQSFTGAFNISIDQTTPLGTIFNMRFVLADSTDTAVVTKLFIVGKQVVMSNDSSSICNAVFYDPGTINNYGNNQNYLKTIKPEIPGNTLSVKFSSFALEADIDCQYDYLEIFDGPTVSSPLIGKYCGSNSPDSIVSTDPTGALTFNF